MCEYNHKDLEKLNGNEEELTLPDIKKYFKTSGIKGVNRA